MGQFMELESMDLLIQAVANYQEGLDATRNTLISAANACEAAMGSDLVAQKQIGRLNAALSELNRTSLIAAKVAKALLDDRAYVVNNIINN